VFGHGRSFIIYLIYLRQNLNARRDGKNEFYFKKFMKTVVGIHVVATSVSQLVKCVPLLELDG
jgi:hypothetical protein